MRMRPVRQNCVSNFSRLARQRRLPVVAARLFFYLTEISCGGKVRMRAEGKIAKAILASSQAAVLRGSDVGYMYSNLTSNCNKV